MLGRLAKSILAFTAFSAVAGASTVTFVTAGGATESGGNPVNASATFTTSLNSVSITLTDLLANPTTVAQLLSDLTFTLSNGAITTGLTSSSGQQLTVAANGTFTLGATTSTGWGVDAGTNHLTALGFIGPAGLIIGPPGGGGVYSNANSSIAGNGPHNPFINQSATFTLGFAPAAGVTSSTTVTSVIFSFGTTAGNNVPGGNVPEPISLSLVGGGLIALYFVRRRVKS